MVIDSVKSFENYVKLHKGFEKVYEFLKSNDLHTLPVGKVAIEPNDIWCSIWEGKGFDLEHRTKLEVHDSFIDIHILLDGAETMGFKNRTLCDATHTKYNEADDIAFFDDEPEVYVSNGVDNFIIVFPTDAHAPLISDGYIKKAIFKVRF